MHGRYPSSPRDLYYTKESMTISLRSKDSNLISHMGSKKVSSILLRRARPPLALKGFENISKTNRTKTTNPTTEPLWKEWILGLESPNRQQEVET